MKLNLLTNATVVDDAIRFVSTMSKENLKSSSGKDDQEESNEPDYDEGQYKLQEEAGEKVATGKVFELLSLAWTGYC